ncbi:hypothetical protein RND71_009843 [Anisodus tanguticus]|uniref:Uncharacterized protein n=1 Tax=Anisodus tanguticus TaxID=243964 RepID=A0AAE1SJ80_9SOLA|nr:hypothetical protein RND71_009843 [Anisodus tanguticus]
MRLRSSKKMNLESSPHPKQNPPKRNNEPTSSSDMPISVDTPHFLHQPKLQKNLANLKPMVHNEVQKAREMEPNAPRRMFVYEEINSDEDELMRIRNKKDIQAGMLGLFIHSQFFPSRVLEGPEVNSYSAFMLEYENMILVNKKEKPSGVSAKLWELDKFVNNEGQQQFSELKNDPIRVPGLKNQLMAELEIFTQEPLGKKCFHGKFIMIQFFPRS